jgi:hypothetical protein
MSKQDPATKSVSTGACSTILTSTDIIGSKEKMSSPECMFSQHVVFCGTERSVPTLALYKVTSSKLEIKDEIVLKTDRKF